MASNPAAALLTEQHRLAQLRIGAVTAAQVHQTWPLLELDNLDRTFPRWLTAVQAIVGGQNRISAQLAAGYYTTFRQLEIGRARPFVPVIVAPPAADAVATSMLVTGPVAVKTGLGRGIALTKVAEIASARTAGAGMRHALAGGRDTITQSVAADPRALGWARAASGRACAFCAMLASRGPVYSDTTVDFEAHDHCSCATEPVYSTDAAWPAGSEHYRSLYNEATKDVPRGGDLLNAFRRALATA